MKTNYTYTEEFRREVINTAAAEGVTAAAAKHSVAASSVFGWLRADKEGKLSNPSTKTEQTKKNNHKLEFRRAVLDYAAAHTHREAAKKFRVCPSSISNWVKADKVGMLANPISRGIKAIDTRATLAEDMGTIKKPKRSAPSRGTAPADMLNFFEGKKAFCVECGAANSGGFHSFIERNEKRQLKDFHCISCGAVLTDSLLSHYEQNKENAKA